MSRHSAIPEIRPGEIGMHRLRDYVIRFAFGAAIALIAGLVGIKWGPRVGGLFLGFPAILPASLTLIEKKLGKEEAAIDSEGAILGAIALVVFACVISLTVARWGVVASLGGSLAIWLTVAVGLYAAVRAIFHREPAPP